MMSDPALAKRLEMLTGQDAVCCTEDLQREADEARAAPTFDLALARAKALSDPNRLLAAALVKRRGDVCACEVQAALGLTHATVSHHMKTLVEAGIVTAEKRGKWVHYALDPAVNALVP